MHILNTLPQRLDSGATPTFTGALFTDNITAPDLILGTSGPSAKSSIAARAARQGLVFDGTGQISFASIPAFGTGDFTMSGYINSTLSGINNRYIMLRTSGLGFGVECSVNGARAFFEGGVYAYGPSAITARTWAHILVRRLNSFTTVYVNGIAGTPLADTTNYSTAINVSPATEKILSGLLIYNRALSAAEVVSLYEAGVPAGADYNTASNTAVNLATTVNSGYDTFSGASASGFTAVKTTTAAAASAYSGTDISIAVGQRLRIAFTCTLTSGTLPVIYLSNTGGTLASGPSAQITAGANVIELTCTIANATARARFFNSPADTVNYAISGLSVTRIGLLLAPDAAQSGGGLVWYDTSGNAANITLPATGVSWNVPTSGRGLFADGTAAAPSISFAADAGTGFYRSAANTVSVSVGGARGFDFSGAGFTLRGVPILGTDSIAITAGGSNRNITLTPSGTGTVVSTNVNFDVTSSLVTAEVYCTAAFAIGRGGSIALGGLVDGSNSSTFAAIAGQKESAVSGATGGYLGLFTRANGAAMTERARILSTGRFLLGTTTDSGALLQIGTNTTTSSGGMVFGTDTFLYRGGSGNLTVSGPVPVFALVPSVGTQSGFFTVVNSGGTTYIGCDNSTGSNFGCGAYAAVFGSGSESTGIVSGGVKALTIAKTTLASTFVGTVQTTNIGLGAAPLSAPKIYAYGGANNEILRAASGVDGPTSIILDQTTRLLRFVDGSGPTNRMTLDMTTGAAAFSGSVALGGALKLANAYVAGAVVGTGYVTIQDSTGTTYRVPVLV